GCRRHRRNADGVQVDRRCNGSAEGSGGSGTHIASGCLRERVTLSPWRCRGGRISLSSASASDVSEWPRFRRQQERQFLTRQLLSPFLRSASSPSLPTAQPLATDEESCYPRAHG